MLGIIYGLISMFGFGISNAIAKVPSSAIGSRKTIFYRGMGISFVMLVLLIVFREGVVWSVPYMLLAIAIAIFAYIPFATFYHALTKGSVGVVSPIANSSVIITVLLSVLFFGEGLAVLAWAAIGAIVLGIVLLSVDFQDIKRSHLFDIASGIPYAMVSCLLWGVVFFLFKIPVTVLGPILTTFLIETGVWLSSYVHTRIGKISLRLPTRRILWSILVVAIFGSLGTLFFNLYRKISPHYPVPSSS